MDLAKIVKDANIHTKQLHPIAAARIGYAIQTSFEGGEWQWFDEYYGFKLMPFDVCNKQVKEYQPDNPRYKYRIVAIVEVK